MPAFIGSIVSPVSRRVLEYTRERQHLEVHHGDVVLRVAERRAEVKPLVSLVQEGGDQVLAEEDEHEQEQRD